MSTRIWKSSTNFRPYPDPCKESQEGHKLVSVCEVNLFVVNNEPDLWK